MANKKKKKKRSLVERFFGSKKIKGVKARTQLGPELGARKKTTKKKTTKKKR